MCPIRVHWHVKENYREYWRVKVTITNFNMYSNYSDWNLYGENGNVQTEMLLHKDAADFTFSGGWAFPRRLSFNGHDCVMPPPDSYPTLPNGSSTMSSLVHCVSLVLSSLLRKVFEATNPEMAVLVPHQLCSWMVRSDGVRLAYVVLSCMKLRHKVAEKGRMQNVAYAS
ncbi:hypothetical protein C4D60_Mb04t34210 [Musa balbisiana]|uniref:COBRA C-terminal domain-containing protein n=1 Tax=Musa balbisiana TaxID=52838 RepID=A0A4S8KH93_MUSBA|nr:hypothetical protein C4D60_Mb04t34210 [Musa balbisiana]